MTPEPVLDLCVTLDLKKSILLRLVSDMWPSVARAALGYQSLRMPYADRVSSALSRDMSSSNA